jgi:hypothetical protein
MCSSVDKCALIVLAVDLDQCGPQQLEHLDAHRLIVDECAGATVRQLHAAQNQFVLGRYIVSLEQRARGMVACDIEYGGHLALFDALPYQRLIAAPSQSQRESIEQNRFPRAGLPCEHGKAIGKINIEPVYQDNIADRKSGEHGAQSKASSGPDAFRASTSCRFCIIKDADGRHKAGQ